MLGPRKPKVVVTIHGIQTHGEWQKRITPHLARHGLVPYHIHYGWFSLIKFLLPCSREKQIQAIRDELRNLVVSVGARRISVIAHSFGTYIAMEALIRENGGLLYDRVVLTGSILPREFDWTQLISDKKWVMAVRNERATSDWVVVVASWASRWLKRILRLNAGDSGKNDFMQRLPTLLDNYVVDRHSGMHNALRFEQWARFIAYPTLPADLLTKVTTEMQAFRQEVAKILGQPPDLVRVNLFAPMDGALRIVPGAVDNMKYAPEFDLGIELGHGATGAAFASGNPCIVVKRGDAWSGDQLPTSELEKIEPRLRWIVSLPVRSETRSTIVGVVNVDGLDNVPKMLDDPNTDDYKAALLAFHGGMLGRFSPCLEAAFRGDKLAHAEV